MIELGRLTKKASQLLDTAVTLLFNVDDENIKTLLCTRLLLTEGSVKLQGYKAEERIGEAQKQEVQEAERQELREERARREDEKETTEEERVEPRTEEAKETTEEERVEPTSEEAGELTGSAALETAQTEAQDALLEEGPTTPAAVPPESAADTLESEAESEATDTVAQEAVENEARETDSIFVGVEKNEEWAPEAAATAETMPEQTESEVTESAVEAVRAEEAGTKGAEGDRTDAAPAKEQASPVDEQEAEAPQTIIEQEETVVAVDDETGEEEVVSDDREGVVLEGAATASVERTLDEAYALVKEALTERYEKRFKNPPPSDMRQLFSELSSEVIIPHEELIRRLVKTVGEDAEYDQELEERVAAVLDDFLQGIR